MKYIDLCKKENVSLEDISWIFQKIRSQPLILRAVPSWTKMMAGKKNTCRIFLAGLWIFKILLKMTYNWLMCLIA